MKVLLYVNSHLPRIGGRELVVHNLALQYRELGHEVMVAGASNWWKYRHLQYGYPLHRWPALPILPKDTSRAMMLALSRLISPFDVLHAHSTYPAGYSATRLKRWLKRPIVITPHGEDINVVPDIGFGQRLDPEQDRKIRFAVQHADVVTSISRTITESLLDVGVDRDRIVEISNGVDLARFKRPSTLDVLDHMGLPPDTVLVTSIGNYHRRKGHETLIASFLRAHAKHPSLRLAIVGNPSSKLVDEVTRAGHGHLIRFTGMLQTPPPGSSEPDILAALLQSTQVYVSSSINEGAEGLSLALLEAMAAGACPVVTRISGNRDVIQSGVNGLLVTPGDEADLAEKILSVATCPGLADRLRSQARVTVSAFGWKRVAERYLCLYESLRSRD